VGAQGSRRGSPAALAKGLRRLAVREGKTDEPTLKANVTEGKPMKDEGGLGQVKGKTKEDLGRGEKHGKSGRKRGKKT